MTDEPERAPPPRSTRTSLLSRLTNEPRRFRFDAMVRIFLRASRQNEPSAAVRFRTPPGLTFPATDVLDVRRGGERPDVVVGLMGLTGPSGVLPRYYSEIVSQTLRGRSTALHQFLDMLGERFVGFFASAPIKYRPARAAETALMRKPSAPDPITQALLSLTGYGTPHAAPHLSAGTEPLLHYAGLFAMRPRSADRLTAMLTDWLNMKVEILEYTGAWLGVPVDQRTRIGVGGMFARLGIDAAAGVRAWSPEARMIIRIGPLTQEAFRRMRPDSPALKRVVALVRAYVGIELGFVINPVLAASEIAPLRLDGALAATPKLGWNTWLPISAGSGVRPTDAPDAVFDADMIERFPLEQTVQRA
jgi:type VI secretion system protein ImpH